MLLQVYALMNKIHPKKKKQLRKGCVLEGRGCFLNMLHISNYLNYKVRRLLKSPVITCKLPVQLLFYVPVINGRYIKVVHLKWLIP